MLKKYLSYIKYVKSRSIHQLANAVMIKHAYWKGAYINAHPLGLNIYVTDRCTLNCKMCLQHSLDNTLDPLLANYVHKIGKDMTLETFDYILNLFNKSLSVCLAGVGEPFLNSGLIDMIKLANYNDKSVSVITNGTVLYDKAKDIIKSPLDDISISLNAIKKEEYERISCCSKEYFDLVVENVFRLVHLRNRAKSKLKIKISFICHKGNYKTILDMIEFSERLGVNEVDFINLMPTMKCGFSEEKSLYNDDIDVIDLFNSINLEEYKLNVRLPKLFVRNCQNRICRWYFENLSIDSEGNISSCGAIMSPNPIYGNIFKDKDPWNNQHFIDMRNMFWDKSIPLNKCCKYCSNNLL